MNPSKLFPLVITDKLAETKAFYTQTAGFEITIEQGEYLQVRHGHDPASPELAFMAPCTEGPLGELPRFEGKGLIVSVPTANADEKHAAIAKRGGRGMSEPTDKPWGWRSFAIADPNGVVLDFFHEAADSSAADATG